jgi:hypothetical protein
MQTVTADGPTRLGSDGEFAPYTDQSKTSGSWPTEPEAAKAFDAAVEASGMFRSHPEVSGHYMLSKYRVDWVDQKPRIDRILVPSAEARAIGWNIGPIGVELKNSGHALGPLVAQALDYSTAIWEMPLGWLIKLRWIFIFPNESTFGPLASVMVQNCIGIANVVRGELRLKTDQSNVLSRSPEGWKFKSPPSGNKIGSR